MKKSKLMRICETLADTAENPTHFMIIRQVKSPLHNLNPWPELNIDRQLDMYAIHFYGNGVELATKMQFGVNTYIFYEEKLYPLYCLFMACDDKPINLKNGKLPVPEDGGSLINSIEIAEGLWDEYSEVIGESISDMEFWSGRGVIGKDQFIRAIKRALSKK